MLLLMFLYVVQTLCSLFMPYIMSDMVENGIRKGDMHYIIIEGAIMLAVAICAVVFSLLSVRTSTSFSANIIADTRRTIFNKVNSLSFEQFSKIGTGSLITRITDDVSWVEDVLSQAPYMFVAAPITFVGGIALSFRGDWLIPLIMLGVSVVVLSFSIIVTMKLDKYWELGDQLSDEQNRAMRERLSGIRVVRAFDKESYEHQRVAKATTKMNNCFVHNNIISGIISPIVSLALNITTVVIIYIGAIRLQNSDTLLAGDIIATIQYIALIVNAVLILSWGVSMIPPVKVSLGRISEILDLENTHEEAVKNTEKQKLQGTIRFENVNFAYENAQANALTDISLDIHNGDIIGIIGGTGSGKSTLIKLIMDFYAATDGKRFFDGVDYDRLAPSQVRDNISIALQKATIFEGTIAENIRMGNANATDEQVQKVLEVSQMAEFVALQDEKTNYKLTQAGNNISGGQKQRINIARAIVKDASVYIFDDSFSALDFLTESNLRKALNKYLDGKTQIVVTQRAATAMRCDKVYVLDGGHIVGFGTHEELIQTCPTYKEIYQSQLGGGKVE